MEMERRGERGGKKLNGKKKGDGKKK